MTFRARTLCAGLLAAIAMQAHATQIDLAADGQWTPFAVDNQVGPAFDVGWIDTETLSPGYGSMLEFDITIESGSQGRLTVVDAGFAGDRFRVFDGNVVLGETSPVPATDAGSAPFELDYDAALANRAFSSRVFRLGAGVHHITGELTQSVGADGQPLVATLGAVKLDAAPVPVPAAFITLGSGMLALLRRARRRA